MTPCRRGSPRYRNAAAAVQATLPMRHYLRSSGTVPVGMPVYIPEVCYVIGLQASARYGLNSSDAWSTSVWRCSTSAGVTWAIDFRLSALAAVSAGAEETQTGNSFKKVIAQSQLGFPELSTQPITGAGSHLYGVADALCKVTRVPSVRSSAENVYIRDSRLFCLPWHRRNILR